MPHRTGTVHCPMCLWRLLWLLPRTVALSGHYAVDRCADIRCSAWCTGQSGATPDSPVNYSGVRLETWGEEFEVDPPWCTGHCPVRQTRVLFYLFCSFLLNPNSSLFIGLCWTFGTCRTYILEQTCDRTSQVIRPTYSYPCPMDLRQPYRCPWSLDKFGICISYLAQERFTRHADITIHRTYENAEAVTITYFILK
jgi:hypothetical protein